MPVKRTNEELADLINERISEDGWSIKPNGDRFVLVPPEGDKRRSFATKWTGIKLSVPGFIDSDGEFGYGV